MKHYESVKIDKKQIPKNLLYQPSKANVGLLVRDESEGMIIAQSSQIALP